VKDTCNGLIDSLIARTRLVSNFDAQDGMQLSRHFIFGEDHLHLRCHRTRYHRCRPGLSFNVGYSNIEYALDANVSQKVLDSDYSRVTDVVSNMHALQ
jgi:hypothetical protein